MFKRKILQLFFLISLFNPAPIKALDSERIKPFLVGLFPASLGIICYKKYSSLTREIDELKKLLAEEENLSAAKKIMLAISRCKSKEKLCLFFCIVSGAFGFEHILNNVQFLDFLKNSCSLACINYAAITASVFLLFPEIFNLLKSDDEIIRECMLDYLYRQSKISSVVGATDKASSKFEVIPAKKLKDFSLEEAVMASHVKRGLQDFKFCFENMDKIFEQKIQIPRGILLSGPSGCGKTLIAKSFAAGLGVNFIYATGSLFVDKYVGSGASSMRDLIELAKKNSPCVVFFDEIDAIARKRGLREGAGREYDFVLNQLLTEMDGKSVSKKWDGIIFVGATNLSLDILDPALLRPGRLDKHFKIELPNFNARAELFRKNLEKSNVSFDVLGIEDLARESIGMSGAEIHKTVNQALLDFVQNDVNANVENMGTDFVFDALERSQFGEPDASLANISHEEMRRTAYHEAGHAIVSLVTPGAVPLRKITIIPRVGGALGLNLFLPDEEVYSKDCTHFIASIRVSLGGLVAEKLLYGEHSSGVSSDLEKATAVAKYMVCHAGMSEFGTHVALNHKSKEVEAVVKTIIDENLQVVNELLSQPKNRAMLERLANELLKVKTMNRQAVKKLLELD